jgi:uncharacterized membrane protein YfcA
MPFAPSLPDLPWYALAAIPLIVLIAYTIFGATGFGSSIVEVPVLAHLFPLTFAVPLATSLDAFAAPATSLRLRHLVLWREVLRLLPPILLGVSLGGTLLLTMPRAPATLALGIFVTVYGTYLLAGPRALRRAPAWAAWPFGTFGGMFSAIFGTGGPIFMVFLSARIADKAALRATSAAVVTFIVWTRFIVFAVTGLLFNAKLVTLAVLMLPVMALGLKLGNHLHHTLSRAGVLRLIAAMLVVNGTALVLRAIELMRA